MKNRSNSNPAQSPPADENRAHEPGRAKLDLDRPGIVLKQDTKNHSDFCKETQIANWEDEGGADINSAPDIHRHGSLDMTSFLSSQLETAETLIETGDYDAAYSELEAAAERFINYRDKINSSFNKSIALMSTSGGPAIAPHPKALQLVRIRKQLTA